MKIAIVTLPLHANYGGILQAYALQTVLQRMGHDVCHLQPKIEFQPLHPAWKMPFVWVKRLIRKCFFGEWKLPIFEHPRRWERKYTYAFIHANISIHPLKDDDWNESLAKEYDAFIVGSDQVWRSCYANPLERYFLSFLGDTSNLRIAYAASLGAEECDFSSDQIKRCRTLLHKFTSVSVREQSGVEICKKLFGVDAEHVLDSTLLLSRTDYLKLTSREHSNRGNLMVYIIDENAATKEFVSKIAKSKGLTPFRTNSKIENGLAKGSDRQQPPVEQWLQGFDDAQLVITDSFHGCVFSIIFNKPFICVGNNNRGIARFCSLFERFGLQQCMVNLEQPFEMPDIDWGEVNLRLEKLREHSLGYLKQALYAYKN